MKFKEFRIKSKYVSSLVVATALSIGVLGMSYAAWTDTNTIDVGISLLQLTPDGGTEEDDTQQGEGVLPMKETSSNGGCGTGKSYKDSIIGISTNLNGDYEIALKDAYVVEDKEGLGKRLDFTDVEGHSTNNCNYHTLKEATTLLAGKGNKGSVIQTSTLTNNKLIIGIEIDGIGHVGWLIENIIQKDCYVHVELEYTHIKTGLKANHTLIIGAKRGAVKPLTTTPAALTIKPPTTTPPALTIIPEKADIPMILPLEWD